MSKLRTLHAVLAARGLLDVKADLVSAFTGGRAESSREMRPEEVDSLLRHLDYSPPQPSQGDAKDRKRKRIIAIAHDMGWRVPGTRKVDMGRIEAFLQSERSAAKKPLNKLDSKELSAVIYQFEQMRSTLLKKL